MAKGRTWERSEILALAGGTIWLVIVVVLQPSPFDVIWAHALFMFAPLVLVPLGLGFYGHDERSRWQARLWRTVRILQLPSALLLGWAFFLPQGAFSAFLAVPWLATTAILGLVGLERACEHRRGPLWELCQDAALAFLAVGGYWTVFDRWGVRPLDFEPVIVLLTAIHFHYAGFALLLLAGLAMRVMPGTASRLAGLGVIAAVPLTAAGITASQLDLGPMLESLSAWIMALAGSLTGWLYLQLSLRRECSGRCRILFFVSGASLIAGMLLAALYGSRFFLPVSWLDIPWMRTIHGTANVIGCFSGLIGWQFSPSIRLANEGQMTNDKGLI